MQRGPAILIGLLLGATIAAGQKAEDIGELKIAAEHGDAQAQVRLANACLSNARPNDARRWYEAAAGQNSAEAQFQLGTLLLTGKPGTPREQSVAANPNVALMWIYTAATNGHKVAWRSLARCLQTGSNCATNLPEAYAWLILSADGGDPVGRSEMNQLALALASPDILAGKAIFAAMKTNHWPAPPSVEIPRIVKLLKVQSNVISHQGEKLVIIGNTTMTEGEQTDVILDGQRVKLTCLKIDSNSVQVQVEGEAKPRLLRNSFGDGPPEPRK